MKLIFAGTPDFAASALTALIAAGHEIALVLTQPDRPAGRGMKLKPSAVKGVALEHGLRVEQPLSVKTPEALAMLEAVEADVMVVAAYGLILPQAVLQVPKRGCLNIHASLLPRWRGAAPIQRAILAGDAETGITIMQMDVGLDTGDMLLPCVQPILPDDTAATLHDRLAAQGAEAIVQALAQLDTLTPVPQPEAGVTYAAKLEKSEGLLDWQSSAEALAVRVRAFNPVPACYTFLDGAPFKVWRAHAVEGSGTAGEIIAASAAGITVATGEGCLVLDEIQPAGSKRMSAAAFVAGRPSLVGQRFGETPSNEK